MNEEGQEAGGTARAARPYTAVIGILFLAAIVFAGINAINNKSSGLKPGQPVPKFAAPSATGTLIGDANVTPNRACSVHGKDVINICDYFNRPLVLTVWFSRCGGHCEPQLDRIEQIRTRFPKVAFVGLDVRESLDNARKRVLKHGWRFPMALDRDGAVSALYGVIVGPTTYFIYPRARTGEAGVLRKEVRHELDIPALTAEVRALVNASQRRRAERRG